MWTLLLLSLLVAGCSSIPRHVIMAPDVFYIGIPQKIHVELFDVTSSHDVEVAVRLPSSSKVISRDHALISADKPKFLTIKIDSDEISDKHEYVRLFAKCRGPQLRFNSNAKVRLSYRDGILLIQTDKPIYTPTEKAKLNVIPLGFDLKPSYKKVEIILKNPQGIAVQQWQNMVTKSGFIYKLIDLSYAMTGNWTVDGYHGHLFAHKVSVKFEVREYILPTFSVIVKGPRYIIPTDTYFNVSGKAQYSYGKKVVGKVAVRLSILGLQREPLLVMTYRSLFHDSSFAFQVQTKNIRNLLQNKWFPQGCRLQIQADVTEKSTGVTERTVENSFYFVTTPYRIEYVNTARYFKPGMPFQIKAKVSYPNRESAVGIPVKLTVKEYGASNSVKLTTRRAITNNEGIITFIINVRRQARRLDIKLKTVSQHVNERQRASKNFIAFASESTQMIQLQQYRPAKVGSNAYCDTILSGTVNQITYLVVSRGQIVHSATLKKKFGVTVTFSFKVTPLMSPSSRLVAYYVNKSTGKIVSDSILLEIEAELPNPLSIVSSRQSDHYSPMMSYELRILGSVGTNVTLMGFDQSIHIQSKGNILSPGKVFKQLKDSYIDEATGGRNAKDVFKNARMVVISKDMIINTATRTNGNRRKSKRSLSPFEELFVNPDFEDILEFTITRSYFPRTWLVEAITISRNETLEDCRKLHRDVQSKCGSAVLPVSLPDTMTTWVVQAIGVSNTNGFGIAKPLYITTFKPFFIHLSMPYSVQRGEEVTILATLFNYNDYDVAVHISLKGDDGFCSMAFPKRSFRMTSNVIPIKAQDSVAYPITIIPIKYGKIRIDVAAISLNASDRISKYLLVVPEGERKILVQSYVLDPKEYLKKQRGKNQSVAPKELTFPGIETHSKGVQMNKIKLELPKNAIPGSITAKVYLKGTVNVSDLEAGRVKLDLRIKIRNKYQKLTKHNAVVRQEIDVLRYLGQEINITTLGTGVAQMTVEVRYNVPHTKERCNYHLNLTVGQGAKQFYYSTSPLSRRNRRIAVRPRRAIKEKIRKRNSRKRSRKNKKIWKKMKPSLNKKQVTPDNSELVLTVCTQYKKPGRSGMTVIEVGCLTGYTSNEETLMKLVNKDNDSNLSYRTSDKAVEFFANEIDSVKPFCITFNMNQVFDVGIIQPVPIKVYEYHEPYNKCTLFYNLGKKPRSVGSCRGNICRCTKERCPEAYPAIRNIHRRSRRICRKYDFVIKGQVVYADEDYRWLTYDIKVTQVIKGKKGLKVNDIINVQKSVDCIYPSLRRHQLVLFMGKMKQGQYMFDSHALVKELFSRRDITEVNKLAVRIGKGKCK